MSNKTLIHHSLRLSRLDYPVPTVRNLTFADRILDGKIKWSTPFGLWKCDSPGFDTAISQFFLLKMKKIQYTEVFEISQLLFLSKY